MNKNLIYFRGSIDEIIQDDESERLLTFPNVLIAHQAFYQRGNADRKWRNRNAEKVSTDKRGKNG
jgi:hypothetical protein